MIGTTYLDCLCQKAIARLFFCLFSSPFPPRTTTAIRVLQVVFNVSLIRWKRVLRSSCSVDVSETVFDLFLVVLLSVRSLPALWFFCLIELSSVQRWSHSPRQHVTHSAWISVRIQWIQIEGSRSTALAFFFFNLHHSAVATADVCNILIYLNVYILYKEF